MLYEINEKLLEEEPYIIIGEVVLDPEIYDTIVESFQDLITEVVKLNRDVFLTDNKGKKVAILIRTQKGMGGHSGNSSQHDVSVKISYPKELSGLSIEVPRNKNEEIRIIGNYKKSNKKEIEMAKEFVKNNNWDLRNIFFTDNEYSGRKSYERIIKRTPNIGLNFDLSSNEIGEDDIYNYYLKKIGKE